MLHGKASTITGYSCLHIYGLSIARSDDTACCSGYSDTTGGLNLFNLYVALSRSSGRLTICLLRSFDDKLFQASHTAELLEEDDRLKELDTKSKAEWEKMERRQCRDARISRCTYTDQCSPELVCTTQHSHMHPTRMRAL